VFGGFCQRQRQQARHFENAGLLTGQIPASRSPATKPPEFAAPTGNAGKLGVTVTDGAAVVVCAKRKTDVKPVFCRSPTTIS